MSTKSMIYLGMVIGSTIGGAVPMLWGNSVLSLTSILLSGAGGFAGIIIAYKLTTE